MIGILVIAHGELGESLISCASHVLGKKLPQLNSFAVSHEVDPSEQLPQIQSLITSLDSGDGVLVLSDLYGATPCNIVTKLLAKKGVAGVAGVNLPMLVRVLNYRHEALATCVTKAVSGGRDGVVHFTTTGCEHASLNNSIINS